MSAERVRVLDVEALLAPIPGGDGAGTDLRYEDTYDTIKVLRRTAEAATDARKPWLDLIDALSDAIAEESKDLRLAVWLADAAVRTYGFEAVVDSVTLIRELLHRFWTSAFPIIDAADDEPLAARAALVDWLNARLAELVAQAPLTDRESKYSLVHYEATQETNAEKRVALSQSWPSLEKFDAELDATASPALVELRARVSEARDVTQAADRALFALFNPPRGAEQDAPVVSVSLGQVRRTLENCQRLIDRALKRRGYTAEPTTGPATQNVVAPKPAPVVETSSETPPPAVAPPMPHSMPVPALNSREAALQQVRAATKWLREDNSRSPLPYILTRALSSGIMLAYDSLEKAGSLPAPPSDIRQRLRSLAGSEQWLELLHETETYLASAEKQVWLDAYRYSALALEKLGQSHAEALRTVKQQVCDLRDLFPSLPSSEMDDGTPVAGREAREFFETTARPGTATQGAVRQDAAARPDAAPAAGSPNPAVDAHEAVWTEALALHAKGRLPDAVAVLHARAAIATSGRSRFLHRLQTAELLLKAGEVSLALPIVEELSTELDRNALESWEEPSIGLRVWAALYKCAETADRNDEAGKARRKVAFSRICRLDPTYAMTLEPKSASR